MQNPDQKNKFNLGCLPFIILFIIFFGAWWWIPFIIIVIVFILVVLPILKKGLAKYWYEIKDLFSKNWLNVFKDFMKKLEKDYQIKKVIKEKEIYDEIDNENIDDTFGNTTSKDELMQSYVKIQKDLNLNWLINFWKNNQSDIWDKVWKTIKIILGLVIFIVAVNIFVPLLYDKNISKLDFFKDVKFIDNLAFESSPVLRIILAIIVLFIIFKVSKDYFKNSKK